MKDVAINDDAEEAFKPPDVKRYILFYPEAQSLKITKIAAGLVF